MAYRKLHGQARLQQYMYNRYTSSRLYKEYESSKDESIISKGKCTWKKPEMPEKGMERFCNRQKDHVELPEKPVSCSKLVHFYVSGLGKAVKIMHRDDIKSTDGHYIYTVKSFKGEKHKADKDSKVLKKHAAKKKVRVKFVKIDEGNGKVREMRLVRTEGKNLVYTNMHSTNW